MTQTIPAIFEAGCFRPLSPLNFAEAEQVLLTIQSATSDSPQFQAWPRVAPTLVKCVEPKITHEKAREILANVPDNWYEEYRLDREKQF